MRQGAEISHKGGIDPTTQRIPTNQPTKSTHTTLLIFLDSITITITAITDCSFLHFNSLCFFCLQMPGTIQVSVLDLLDFPSSSSSTISIKVSMGKREFQTWDKGDFLFPLTSLREIIVVTIHDAEGNVLSRTGVETILVIEKGTWDDFFVLEGGGRLHMKLQFSLSNAERKRIQELREIALKKKQEELLISRARHLDIAALASVRSNAESSSMSLNHEVTDSSESPVQMEGGSSGAEFLRNANNLSKKALSGSLAEDGVLELAMKDSIPGTGDSQEIFLHQLEEPIHDAKAEKQVVDKIKTRVPPLDVSTSSGEGTVLLSGQEKVIDKNETGIPPDTPKEAISSLEDFDTQSIDHSVSDTIEVDRTLNENNTLGSPTDPGNYTISTKSGEELSINKNETLIPPPNIYVRRITSLKDLRNHSNSSKFGEVQMRNKSKLLVPPTDVPMRRISSYGNFGERLYSSALEEDRVVIPEKPNVVKRSPSNVRKMISAFETSQTKGQAIRADPPIIRTQPVKSKFNISPGEPTVKEVTKDGNSYRTMQTEEIGSSSSSIGKSKEMHSQEESKELSATVKTRERNLQESVSELGQQIPDSLEQDGRDKLREQQSSQEQLMEATCLRQMPAATKILETDQHPNNEARLRTCVQHIEKPIIVESACDKTRVTEDHGAKKHPFGSSGSCIFTDESRPFCITTGSRQLMNLLGGSSNCSETDRAEKSSYQTDATDEQNLRHATRNEVQKIRKASGSNVEGPHNVFEALVGQAGKVAAIAAFGALVIFARER